MSERLEIFEVGPRDGLQNESRRIATADKIALVDMLSVCGFRRIEVASFVSPRWVPQMADSADVLAGIRRDAGISYAGLTPNMQGYAAAKAAKADEIAIFSSASEGFSHANINCSIADSHARFAPIVAAAKDDGIPVRGYISMVTDCPFDGPTPPGDVARISAVLRDAGCYEISLGDTIGQGRPETIAAMLSAVLDEVPAEMLAGHYHDTAGRALDNIAASAEAGVRVFDAAVGGLGGCPFAPGASGNVASESVNELAARLGFDTGLDAQKLAAAAVFARGLRATDRDANV